MTKYQETAKAILAAVGGEKNIQHVTHCVTRLRLVLDNDEIVNDQVIKNIPKNFHHKKRVQYLRN